MITGDWKTPDTAFAKNLESSVQKFLFRIKDLANLFIMIKNALGQVHIALL